MTRHVDILPFRLDMPLVSPADTARILSAAESVRAARFRFARDRERFARGRAMLRTCLAARLRGVDLAALRIDTEPQGKPFLGTAPHLQFNLSHTGDQAVLAMTDGTAVGLDIEAKDRPIDPLRLGRAVFTYAEQAAVARAPDASRTAIFFALWTAKEAVMKRTGEGVSLAPRSISVALSPGGTPTRATIAGRADPVTLQTIITLATEGQATVRIAEAASLQEVCAWT